MAYNPFVIDQTAGRALAQGVGGLLGGIAERNLAEQQQAEQMAAQQQMQQDIQMALDSGDPLVISNAMIRYPEAQKMIEGAQGFRNEATKQKRIESLMRIKRGEPVGQVVAETADFITQQGGTPTETMAFANLSPEEARRAADEQLAVLLPPDQFKSLMSASAPSDQFTLGEGQARYDESGRLIAERVKPINTIENELKQSKDYFDKAKQLRGEVDKISAPYRKVEESYDRIRATIEGDATGASDMALVFSFMKMLDPGSSVMEGEYSNASNTGGVSAKVRNTYNKLVDGQILTPQQRENFIKQAKSQYKASTKRYKSRMKSYEKLGDRQGIKKEDFIILNADEGDSSIAPSPDSGPQMQAPDAAIQYLNANPQFAEQFRQKYGYLPEGM